MDFWAAINDVGAVVTIAGAVWQAGKRLFKKIHFVILAKQLASQTISLFKKPAKLVSPEIVRFAALLHDLGYSSLQKKLI